MARAPPAAPKRKSGGRGGGATARGRGAGRRGPSAPPGRASDAMVPASPGRGPRSGFAAAGASPASRRGPSPSPRPASPGARAADTAQRRRTTGVRRETAGLKPIDKEIRRLQKDHNYLAFPKIAFARVVKDIQSQFTEEPFRWTAEALFVFQTAAEEYLMYLYADAYLATVHRQRVTLNPEDIRLVRRLRQPHCWVEPI